MKSMECTFNVQVSLLQIHCSWCVGRIASSVRQPAVDTPNVHLQPNSTSFDWVNLHPDSLNISLDNLHINLNNLDICHENLNINPVSSRISLGGLSLCRDSVDIIKPLIIGLSYFDNLVIGLDSLNISFDNLTVSLDSLHANLDDWSTSFHDSTINFDSLRMYLDI